MHEAKRTMKAAGVPVTPGSDGLIEYEEEALREAEHIGYPVLIKATAGGGGRGMRIARNSAELSSAYQTIELKPKSSKTAAFTSKSILKTLATLKFKFSVIITETSSIWRARMFRAAPSSKAD